MCTKLTRSVSQNWTNYLNIGFCVGLLGVLGTTVSRAENVLPSSAQVLSAGQAAYQKNCLACHGAKGDGAGPAGALMNPKPRSFASGTFAKGSKPQELFNTITNGIDGTAMASFKHLTREERSGLVYVVQKFKGTK